MANEPVVVDVNTDDLDQFSLLMEGKAVPKTSEDATNTAEEDDPSATNADDDADIFATSTEDTDDDISDSEEDDGPVDADAQDDDDIFEPAPAKKKQTAKERIAEVTAARRAAEREVEMLREQIELLKSMRSENKETEPAKSVPNKEAVVDDGRPDPDAVDENGNLIYPLGNFDLNYVRDLTDYEIEQKLSKIEQTKAEREAAKAAEDAEKALFEQWQGKLQAAEAEFKDLRPTIAKLDTEFADMAPEKAVFLSRAIMELDNGAAVLYYLANHVDEAQQIATASDAKALVALGKLEAKVSSALAERERKKNTRVTNAPAPPAIVPRGKGAKVSIAADTDDLDAFEKLYFSR